MAAVGNDHLSIGVRTICRIGGYFDRVYQMAMELTAELCRRFRLDPLAPGVVVDHAEGAALGIASNHADVGHWWSRFGTSMDDFRAGVAQRLQKEGRNPSGDPRGSGAEIAGPEEDRNPGFSQAGKCRAGQKRAKKLLERGRFAGWTGTNLSYDFLADHGGPDRLGALDRKE